MKTYPGEFSSGPRSRVRYVSTGERRPPRKYEYVTGEEQAREYLTECCGEEFDADGDHV
jgi:hypothetical protein